MTQMPPDVDHYGYPDAEVITRGDYGALYWVDDDSGAEWLFLWAYRQNLVVEACCEPAATAELFNIAEASYEGLRIDEPARCIGDESDLAREETQPDLRGGLTDVHDFGLPAAARHRRLGHRTRVRPLLPGRAFVDRRFTGRCQHEGESGTPLLPRPRQLARPTGGAPATRS